MANDAKLESKPIEDKNKQKKQEEQKEQEKREKQSRQNDIEALLKAYSDINAKINIIAPLLSEVLLMAVNFDTKIKYDSYLKYRFRIKWIAQTLLVAYGQIQKLSEYMKLVDNKKQDIISEFTEQEPAFK